ncbi:MAG: hypothetical protein AB1657_03610 [Candidatus Micrarchaeota archaeon]
MSRKMRGDLAPSPKQADGRREGPDSLPLLEGLEMRGEVPKDVRRKLERLRKLIRDAGKKGISYVHVATGFGAFTYIDRCGGKESFVKADRIIGELARSEDGYILSALQKVLEAEMAVCPDESTRVLLGDAVFNIGLGLERMEKRRHLN